MAPQEVMEVLVVIMENLAILVVLHLLLVVLVPGQGGSPGYAITGAYGLAGFIVGIVTGILPEPTYGFTTSANATVGFAGTQQVWEFVSTGSTEMSIAKTQHVDLLVVGGGSNVVTKL